MRILSAVAVLAALVSFQGPSPVPVQAVQAARAAPVAQSGERHFLYVAAPGIRNYLEFGGAGVLVFDMDQGHKFVKRIETPASRKEKPENIKGVCASAATKRLYFSTLTRLYCVDLLTEETLWEKALPGGCDRMAIAPDGKRLYVPSLEGPHWNVVDGETGDVVVRVETNSGAHNTVCSLDGARVYLAGLKSPNLAVLDTKTNELIGACGPFGNSVRPFTVNGNRTLCFATVNELLGFEVGDLLTGKVLHRVEVQGFKKGPVKRHGCPSHGVGLTPDEREVWVCDAANQRVHVFDATTTPPRPPKQMASIALREQPGWVTFSLDGRYAYPSTGEVVDVKTRKIVTALTDEKGREVHSEKMVEIVFKDGVPIRTGDQFGLGRASAIGNRPSAIGQKAASGNGPPADSRKPIAEGRQEKIETAKAATDGPEPPRRLWCYVGTYTGKTSKGIYLCELDTLTGKLESKGLAAEAVNPTFLAVHPNRKFLYAVSEVSDLGDRGGKKTGAVAAFAIDPHSGKLTELNREPSGGAGPCHLVVDGGGHNVLVANYSGGSVAVLPIQPDGKLKPPSSVRQHEGKSVNPRRQEAPHAHSINLDPLAKFAFAADLGLDQVLIYKFDAEKGTLSPHATPFAPVAPGAGPRHFAFHPTGRWAYVINEMLCTMTAFEYDAEKGTLKEMQTITTLPHEVKEGYSTAEVVAHPSGRFLYGSNRGHDSIAIFRVDARTGRLTAAGHEPTQGKTPRNFNVDPTGRFLLAANQNSNTIAVFRIDADTGTLRPTGQLVEVPAPVCIRFTPAADVTR